MVLLLVTSSLVGGEEKVIEAACVRYFDAVVTQNGEDVASFMTAETFDWWTETIRKATVLKKDEVQKLSLYEQHSLLFLRLRFSSAELKSIDGRTYINRSYSQGWNSSQALRKVREAFPRCIKRWDIEGANATLQLFYNGQPVPGAMKFKKETTGWKMDGIDQMRLIEERMKEVCRSSGLSVEAFVELMVSKSIGRPFPPEIWNPD